MSQNNDQRTTSPLELWGGLESTVSRVMDGYFSQMGSSPETTREDDLQRVASLGIRAIRYPVLWAHFAPGGRGADWSGPDQRLPALQRLNITPIVGLMHHGSVPRHTSLVDDSLPEQLAAFAATVAQRYPWLDHYTPVNEPLATACFSGLYGVWYPHGHDDYTFVDTLLNQCRATVLAMRAIRKRNPQAKLVQTDDLGKSYGTAAMADVSAFYNERRWLGWDLLCGMVDRHHPLWNYILATGIEEQRVYWFQDNPCPPDIIGVNYRATSERWLDHRVDRYPERYLRAAPERLHVDIETPRALATPTPGIAPLLSETWERYQLPVAVTEAHIDANREDQLRWLAEVWDGAGQARQGGASVRAVTVASLFGSYDWNRMVTECKGSYEPGPYNVRGRQPRPTALAELMQELANGRAPSHPVLQGQGWWRGPGRCYCEPVASSAAVADLAVRRNGNRTSQPMLIAGGAGALGQAFARICEKRKLAYRLLSRQQMDIADPASVAAAIARYQPWAIVNAAGYGSVDQAEADFGRCFRDNTHGPAVLSIACSQHNIRLATFSSDLVFDGKRHRAYVESDAVAPLNAVGHSKAKAERLVLDTDPRALVIRTSALFGPWDAGNFVTRSLNTLRAGQPLMAASDLTVSPTYVPDLVHACLDLLIDKEAGVWHLSSGQALSWAELAAKTCRLAQIDASSLEALPWTQLGHIAPRPANSALSSEKEMLLPELDDALVRYLQLSDPFSQQDYSRQTAYNGCQ